MNQKLIPPTDSALIQYPLLRSRCEGRAMNGVSIEDHIADAVNGVLTYGGENAAVIIKHLALAFLYARALRQKGRPEVSVDKV